VPWLESLSGDRRQDRIWFFIGVRDAYERGREAAVNEKVEPPTLHECRHGYAALMIAAGVNIKALSTFMGHANIRLDKLCGGLSGHGPALRQAFLFFVATHPAVAAAAGFGPTPSPCPL
jgi:hypothetical protein